MENKLCYSVGTVPKFNLKMVERGIHDLSLSWLDTCTSINSGGVKLVLSIPIMILERSLVLQPGKNRGRVILKKWPIRTLCILHKSRNLQFYVWNAWLARNVWSNFSSILWREQVVTFDEILWCPFYSRSTWLGGLF